ncbi:uncharacterized protein B0I36DRAFT_345452 [Microdochium trichocladiopsis]|uniref:Uncharacterized protein n=1 Tax=Microdochium trichocladiopsis TaxID=1682393 RepID=A0A9P8YEB1_9PEZI|nr:uncharacterized protein B0I36DRAFT_345452 [Microdochium trichocladiopsis]KAH7037312.1 hypothetical protein B0I36DRAFT_345452 [Microdochium trichocladiopsis]
MPPSREVTHHQSELERHAEFSLSSREVCSAAGQTSEAQVAALEWRAVRLAGAPRPASSRRLGGPAVGQSNGPRLVLLDAFCFFIVLFSPASPQLGCRQPAASGAELWLGSSSTTGRCRR